MKKISLLLLVVLLIAALPLVSAEASLSVQLQKYEPIPAQPGQYVTAYIEIKNVGDEDATNVVVDILDEFPFTIVGNSQIKVGNLKSQRSFVTDFQVKVNSQAAVGTNKLKIRFSPDGINSWQERSLDIDVKPNDASLSIVDVNSNPSEFTPGADGSLTLSLKNSENVVLRDIGVQIGLVSVSGSTVVDFPFIPTTSATEQRISRLNPNELSDLTFNLKAYPDADPGYYKLPLTISFYDEQGTKTEKTELVGVVIKSIPQLTVFMEKTTIAQKDMQGEVTLKFVNKGVSDLKFLDVVLLESDNYEIVSTDRDYIGDLDSDDYRSEAFTIIPKSDSLNLKVMVSYKDGNNNDYSKNLDVPFHVSKTLANEKKRLSFSAIILIVVLGLLVGSWIRKKIKHKKKNIHKK